MFIFNKFNFNDFLKNDIVAGIYQQRDDLKYEYLCISLIMFRNEFFNFKNNIKFSLFDQECERGTMSEYFKENNIKPKLLKHTAQIDIETNYIFRNNNACDFSYDPEFKSQFVEKSFFHYYRASWDNRDNLYHEPKTKFLKYFLSNWTLYDLNLNNKVHYEKAHAEKHWNGKDHNYKNYRFLY